MVYKYFVKHTGLLKMSASSSECCCSYTILPVQQTVFLVIVNENEIYLAHPIIAENGDLLLPLSGWIPITDEENDIR